MSILTPRKKEEKAVSTASAPAVHEPHQALLHVLKKQWVSERAHDMQAMHKYVFLVDLHSTKPMIRQEVERRYNVTVREVHIVRTEGKLKYYRNMAARRTARKKAIVTLKEGDVIDTQ